ncbi:hypothetical protein [Anaeromyxobacter dehalogenans]|uniref:hypothetical protein n=1 Tax=Anaeromyxobacter dehalogenans TaxID=161493 RepID=UPI0002DD2E2C|nr:hypothetical protein [Anaeromyxobacter dehalogenans]
MTTPKLTLSTLAAMAFVGCAAKASSAPVHPSPPGDPATASFEAVVVGTIHRAHLTEPEYPLPYLAGLIETYRPDLILVEVRPEPFALGRLEDGPFEMTYVSWLGQAKGIAVGPIDWFRDEDVGIDADPEPEPADRHAFEEETAALDARMDRPLTFAEVHSTRQDAAVLSVLNVRARYLVGNASWNRRQAWLHQQALEAIRRQGAHKVLAFVGAFHRPELEAFLAGQGGSVRSPRSIRFDAAKPAAVPPQVIQLWREGAARLRAQAATAPAKRAEALTGKARYFEVAADRAGQCCVEPAAFGPR